MKDTICVIGAGPAGLMAAAAACRPDVKVLLFDKNPYPGKKLLLTGKGRCNITNNCDTAGFLKNVLRNPRFLHSAASAFSPQNTMEFFESLNLPLKTERGQRVFPVSDKSSDVRNSLAKYALKQGVEFIQGEVQKIEKEQDAVTGIFLSGGQHIKCGKVILCTGGLSYPSTGSNGDGYRMAKDLSHTVTPLCPSLIPLTVKEKWVGELAGLSLKNAALKIQDAASKKIVYEDFGELIFTHYGLSGPMVLSASANMTEKMSCQAVIDLKPALKNDILDKRILRDFSENKNRDIKNSLYRLLPKSLIPVIISLAGISPDTKVNSITAENRKNLVNVLKNLTLTVTGFRPIDEAVITRGGISVKEVNPRTMESKLCKGLYFAGEVLDTDAYTGGFNLQIAFSTGYTAGKSAGEYL